MAPEFLNSCHFLHQYWISAEKQGRFGGCQEVARTSGKVSIVAWHRTLIEYKRDKNLYKSCILLLRKSNSPPNLVRDKGIYSTRAGSILTSAGTAWDLRVQLIEHEGEDQ